MNLLGSLFVCKSVMPEQFLHSWLIFKLEFPFATISELPRARARARGGVVWCGVVWCGVVWCGVVWCGVVWCGVVWCGVWWRGADTWCASHCDRFLPILCESYLHPMMNWIPHSTGPEEKNKKKYTEHRKKLRD